MRPSRVSLGDAVTVLMGWSPGTRGTLDKWSVESGRMGPHDEGDFRGEEVKLIMNLIGRLRR